MASLGPNSPSTAVNDTGTGTVAWFSPGDAISSNNVYALVTGGAFGATTSNYIKITGFGFSIPAGATIDGIIVEIERKANVNSPGSNFVIDNIVSMVKGGTITGNNKASGTNWVTSESFFTYGSSTDLWGTSWSDSDINASNFGMVLSVNRNRAGKTNPTASLDLVRITVHYTTGGAATSKALLLAGN